MKWWNNGEKNTRSIQCPGDDWVEGRLYFKRGSHSKEHIEKMKTSLKGRKVWNKGKTCIYDESTRLKMSESAKRRASLGVLPDNTGKAPWNKGLTADIDSRVENKTKGQRREGRYRKGENHPFWTGGPNSDLDAYRRKVHIETQRVYVMNEHIINPEAYPRGKAGVEGAYHLDHIVSIKRAYEMGWSVEKTSSIENLQMLPWKENILKG